MEKKKGRVGYQHTKRKTQSQPSTPQTHPPRSNIPIEVTVQPIKSSQKLQNRDLVILNLGVMKEHSLGVGEALLLRTKDNNLGIGISWPSTDVKKGYAQLESQLIENINVSLGDTVYLERYTGESRDAVKIKLVPLAENENLKLTDEMLRMFILARLVGSYIFPGNNISVSMYGQLYRYGIISVEDSLLPSTSSISTLESPVKLPTSQSVPSILPPLPSSPSSPQNHEIHPPVWMVTSNTIIEVMKINQHIQFNIDQPKENIEKGDSERNLTYNSIGGLDKEISIVRDMVELPLCYPEVFTSLGLQPPRGVLLYGPPGTGKTLIARVLAKQIKTNLFTINGPEIMSKFFGGSEAKLREIFSQAATAAPSLIFIDELDALAPKREEEMHDASKRVVGTLLTLMDGIKQDLRVVVLGATNRPNAIDPALRRAGRFDREVEIGIPTASGRLEILKIYLKTMPHCLNEEQITTLAQTTHGYVGADLSHLCKQAAMASLKRSLDLLRTDNVQKDISIPEILGKKPSSSLKDLKVSIEDFKIAMAEVRPSAMREINVEIPTVRWTDIGGYSELKQHLKEAVEWPIKFPEKFKHFGIDPPRGLLLYGPPGCSKTLTAKAVATESGLNFIPVKGPELFSKYVGDSEKAVREVFRKARAASPSIIFFDEIDALAVSRGEGDSTSVQDRVLSQILNELDGITPLNNVLFLAATNRPDIIDPALMRPGRIDRRIYVPLPDAQARQQIFEIHIKKMKISNDIKIEILTQRTEGYTGAEISQICKEAALHALRINLDSQEVTMKDFEASLKLNPPRVTKSQIEYYEDFTNKTYQF